MAQGKLRLINVFIISKMIDRGKERKTSQVAVGQATPEVVLGPVLPARRQDSLIFRRQIGY
jgi:hypothetical protein